MLTFTGTCGRLLDGGLKMVEDEAVDPEGTVYVVIIDILKELGQAYYL